MHRPKPIRPWPVLSKSSSIPSDLDLHYLQVQAECRHLESLYYAQTHSGRRSTAVLSSPLSESCIQPAGESNPQQSFRRQWSDTEPLYSQVTTEDAQETMQTSCLWKLTVDQKQGEALELLAEQVNSRHRELHAKQELLQTQKAKFQTEKNQFVQLLARLDEEGQELLNREKIIRQRELQRNKSAV